MGHRQRARGAVKVVLKAGEAPMQLGAFGSEEEAAREHDAIVLDLHGRTAATNFGPPQLGAHACPCPAFAPPLLLSCQTVLCVPVLLVPIAHNATQVDGLLGFHGTCSYHMSCWIHAPNDLCCQWPES